MSQQARPNHAVRWSAAAGLAGAMLMNSAAFAQVTTSFDLEGIVNNPGTYDVNSLSAPAFQPPVSQTDTFTAGEHRKGTPLPGFPCITFSRMQPAAVD